MTMPRPDHRLRRWGAGARRDAAPGGALEFLQGHGVDLRTLDELLRAAGDDGLRVKVASTRLREWSRQNGQAAAAVLATRLEADTAKATVMAWRPSGALERYGLNPTPDQWMAPVLDSLRATGFDPRGRERLAISPTDEAPFAFRMSRAAKSSKFSTRTLYDDEERRRILSGAAAAWRSELRLIGNPRSNLARRGSRRYIRLQADLVDAMLPVNPSSPTTCSRSRAIVDPAPRARESLQSGSVRAAHRLPVGAGEPIDPNSLHSPKRMGSERGIRRRSFKRCTGTPPRACTSDAREHQRDERSRIAGRGTERPSRSGSTPETRRRIAPQDPEDQGRSIGRPSKAATRRAGGAVGARGDRHRRANENLAGPAQRRNR